MVKKLFKRLLALVILLIVLFGFTGMYISTQMVTNQKDKIVSALTPDKDDILNAEIEELMAVKPQCAIVLGAGIIDRETPTPMLEDRLKAAVLLYKRGIVPKLLISGDNGTLTHNEIHVMLEYLKREGIPGEDIFCDHAGFSTYDSFYRAKGVYQVKSAVVVTQSYHLYRALYLADKMGIDAVGFGADQKNYRGQSYREIREVLARNKAFLDVFVKRKAKFGGEITPISGDGTYTHGQ